MHEIERKFLLKEPLKDILKRYKHCILVIEQRYLPSTGSWTIRIRQTVTEGEQRYYLTMKRRVTDVSCVEMETRIKQDYYARLVAQCGPALRKMRFEIMHEGSTWELDYFIDPVFDGLVIAEIELDDEDQDFVRPEWLGEEVTHLKEYKNAQMVKRLI